MGGKFDSADGAAMANNLRKFVNEKFLRTCDLHLMRRLMARYRSELTLDLTVLEGEADTARERLRTFFAGPEADYPPALTADLHRIAYLGTGRGMRVLLERARADGVDVITSIADADPRPVDPKYLALRMFLDHRLVFNAASDLLAIENVVSVTEFAGRARDTAVILDQETKRTFEQTAKRLFEADLEGRYCRVGWYEDGDETKLVVVHGAIMTTEWVVEDEEEKTISFRPLATAVLAYNPSEGRLKIGGLEKCQRQEFAELFAATMLGKPEFFNGDEAQVLYTLEPVERAGFAFQFDHKFDPSIVSVKVVEAQADRIASEAKSDKRAAVQWSVRVKDRINALDRMGKVAATVAFGPNAYGLHHIGFRVEFRSEAKPNPTVSVELAPPTSAKFKREFHEDRIMELIRRNGLSVERKPDTAAVAAE